MKTMTPPPAAPASEPTISQRIDRIEQRMQLGWYAPPPPPREK